MDHSLAYFARLPVTETGIADNPVIFPVSLPEGCTVLWLGISTTTGVGARQGGAPTYAGVVMLPATPRTISGSASPEAAIETWYVLNPIAGPANISAPNTTNRTLVFIAAAVTLPGEGFTSAYVGSTGTPGESANPAADSVDGKVGDIVFSLIGTGANAWAPTGSTGIMLTNWGLAGRSAGAQYAIANIDAPISMGWTFATSDDWVIASDRFTAVLPLQTFELTLDLKSKANASLDLKLKVNASLDLKSQVKANTTF